MQSIVADPLYDVEQSGTYIGTGPRFVRRLIAEKRIRYTKLGTHVRIRKSDLDAFIQAGVVEPTDSARGDAGRLRWRHGNGVGPDRRRGPGRFGATDRSLLTDQGRH